MRRSEVAYVAFMFFRPVEGRVVLGFFPHELDNKPNALMPEIVYADVSDVVVERQQIPESELVPLTGFVRGRVTEKSDKDVTLEIDGVGGSKITTISKDMVLRPNQVINVRTGKRSTLAS